MYTNGTLDLGQFFQMLMQPAGIRNIWLCGRGNQLGQSTGIDERAACGR